MAQASRRRQRSRLSPPRCAVSAPRPADPSRLHNLRARRTYGHRSLHRGCSRPLPKPAAQWRRAAWPFTPHTVREAARGGSLDTQLLAMAVGAFCTPIKSRCIHPCSVDLGRPMWVSGDRRNISGLTRTTHTGEVYMRRRYDVKTLTALEFGL